MMNIQANQGASSMFMPNSMYMEPATAMASPMQSDLFQPQCCPMPGGLNSGGIDEILQVVLGAVFEFLSQLLTRFLGQPSPVGVGAMESAAPTISNGQGAAESDGGWIDTAKDIFSGIKDIWGMFSGGGSEGGSFIGTAAKFIGSLF